MRTAIKKTITALVFVLFSFILFLSLSVHLSDNLNVGHALTLIAWIGIALTCVYAIWVGCP